MLPEPKASVTAVGARLDRAGKRLAMSVILLSASMASSFAGQYPVEMAPVQSASKERPCTQLENEAELPPGECGTLTISAVVARLYALHPEGEDD
jgi:hypothetical protein